ncbi:MAG: DUF4230 domain-containing protein [Muribaculaceae bacterium]|nr:DUF4230 domain-containing protein [Muribaculaceae bacterium]
MTFVRLIAVTILGATLLIAGSCSGNNSKDEIADSLTMAKEYTPDFYQEWHRASKLEFASMTVTKTVTTERTAWYKVGERIAVYSFDIYLRAFVDMDKLQPSDISVDDTDRVIRIKLPPVQSEIAGRASELKEEYENIGIFRSRPDSRERATLKEKANEDFRKEFSNNPVYRRELESTALRKAHAYFEALGEAAGYRVEFVDDALPVKKIER